MPILKLLVEHRIMQAVDIDVPEDELEKMTYADAVANAQFDEFQTGNVDTVIVDAWADGNEHFFK